MTVLESCELSRVAGELSLCDLAESLAAVDLNALECYALIVRCEFEYSVSCVSSDLLSTESLLVDSNCRLELVLYLDSLAIVLLSYLAACYGINVLNNAVFDSKAELGNY